MTVMGLNVMNVELSNVSSSAASATPTATALTAKIGWLAPESDASSRDEISHTGGNADVGEYRSNRVDITSVGHQPSFLKLSTRPGARLQKEADGRI